MKAPLTPRDLEASYGFPEGQAEHVEPALDQLFSMRPLPELARYRTPIKGFICAARACIPGAEYRGSGRI